MPFTIEQFFDVFASYNQAVFPMQVILVLTAALTVFLAIYQKPVFDQAIAVALALLWLWAGVVYHLFFFSKINSGAYLFAAMFVAQAFLFFYQGVVKKNLNFRLAPNYYGVIGTILVTFALVVYPIIGTLSGRIYPSIPTFGAPCPVVIYTCGLLIWTGVKFPPHLAIIPLVWATIGSTAAVKLGVTEDYGLPAAGAAVALLMLRRELYALDDEEEVFL